MSGLAIARDVAALRGQVAGWRRAGETVGLVPTMGALHEGHLTLVRRAKERCDRAVATIFVNPKQFDRKEDLESYPRSEAEDVRLLESVGCDLLFAPLDVAVIYPPGFVTRVSVAGLSACLDGLHRPGHFDGVTTVVSKLLLQALPDVAFFGEKDFQQQTIVRRMARDLDIPVEIAAVPTVREADGLAMSSRNRLLTPEQRALAPLLARVLNETAEAIAVDPTAEAAPFIAQARLRLGRGGFDKIDYVELRAADDLGELASLERPGRLLAAAWLGRTRLIDNVAVG
ncbi:pantothenate synthetase [Tistlia consotensis]|uniref:Pantothenate synthetase n=1 Tax=Tistlia consotensis USBA 355 TaxID=560819 RepID=A0A1Y6BA91_9PROT|nr:pantoate--beta-alanine ligase [Tistlia consotensis]SME93843.1 pantothenate synthetase [Tistlia consotensis USBA 355]SNR28854.1 pantothenate synthetase [Tistlia consotensis]